MNLIDQIFFIDTFLNHQKKREAEYLLMNDNFTGGINFKNDSNLWDQKSPWAIKNDSDFDGIPDALDNFLGPGAL